MTNTPPLRILFTTNHRHQVSTLLNQPNFAHLNEIEGIQCDFFNDDYQRYDIVLFMGYDPDIPRARARQPHIRIGVVDLRPSQLPGALGADFIVVNGLEMADWCANHFYHLFQYPIYPVLHGPGKGHETGKKLVVGYHGNRIHLQTMYPYITTALEALADHYQVELWAIYNIEGLGLCNLPLCDPSKVTVRHIQWSEAALRDELSQVDIGIVPNFIPIPDTKKQNKRIAAFPRLFQEHESDTLLRFKATTNAGRLFVFAQLGIPVVSDMFPSALQLIRDGDNGFVAAGAGGWYRGLKRLADSPPLRTLFAQRMMEEVERNWSIPILNRSLVDFMKNLPATPLVPPQLAMATERLADPAFLTAASPSSPWWGRFLVGNNPRK